MGAGKAACLAHGARGATGVRLDGLVRMQSSGSSEGRGGGGGWGMGSAEERAAVIERVGVDKVKRWRRGLLQIGVDVMRTDRVLQFYQSEGQQARLMDTLAVYSWFDSEVGYCQGERKRQASTALHCTALHCTALHRTALHCTALYCTVLHCSAPHCTVCSGARGLRAQGVHCTGRRSHSISRHVVHFTEKFCSEVSHHVCSCQGLPWQDGRPQGLWV